LLPKSNKSVAGLDPKQQEVLFRAFADYQQTRVMLALHHGINTH
jgi:hypothetical protein